jgi:hypothetical protein
MKWGEIQARVRDVPGAKSRWQRSGLRGFAVRLRLFGDAQRDVGGAGRLELNDTL